MIKVLETDNAVLLKVFDSRWKDSSTLWEKIIQKDFEKNLKTWSNKPEWLGNVPRKQSKTRDNRVFLSTESQINKVTARPFKPAITPANESDEAKEIAMNLQEVFLDAYDTRNIKKSMKRGLRYLHLSRLICMKVFWNTEIDDFDAKVANSKKVRFSKNSTNEEESEFAIEEIDDKKILQLIEQFPDQEEAILKEQRISKDDAIANNPDIIYHEVWIGDGTFWKFKNIILNKRKNPYYDFEGLLITAEEKAELEEIQETTTGTEIPEKNGRRRRQMFAKFKENQSQRKQEVAESEDGASKYELYLYNHFDKPRKPYIFGTILEIEDRPVGEVTLIEMVTPLQEGVDKRKRQIADNAELMNGVLKVDTDITTITLADARQIQYDPGGLVYGPGVNQGVSRETGSQLPDMVFNDLQDSRNEIDEIFGTTATLRGSGSDNEKTATGRAILREEGLSRLDEIVSLVDYMGSELYNWWFQMIKVNYTESHFVKVLGGDKSARTIDLMQDDLQDGMEIKIVAGSTLPDDKLFRADRAREDVKDGLIDRVTYLEMAGGYDNPEEIAKKATLSQINPLFTIPLDGEDLQKMVESNQTLIEITPGAAEAMGGGEGDDQQKAQQIAQLRDRFQQIVESEEFQQLPPEEQEAAVAQVKEQLVALGGVEFNRQLA